jgi:hypothetical protein
MEFGVAEVESDAILGGHRAKGGAVVGARFAARDWYSISIDAKCKDRRIGFAVILCKPRNRISKSALAGSIRSILLDP